MSIKIKEPGFLGKTQLVIDGNRIKEPGLLGRTLFRIKGDKIVEPGFLGKTIYVISGNKIKEPGIFGKALYVIDGNAIKEPGILGKTIGKVSGDQHYIGESRMPSETEFQKYKRERNEEEQELKLYAEQIDSELGYVADFTNVREGAKKARVPLKYKTVTATAPALGLNTLSLHSEVVSINSNSVHVSKSIEVDQENPFLCAIDGVLYNKSRTQLLYFPYAHEYEEFIIPKTVKRIEGPAFGASKKVLIHSEVSFIKQGVCIAESFEVDPHNSHLSSIDGVLYNKDQSILIKVPTNYERANFLIPHTVTTIESKAFSYVTKIKNVHIPLNVVDIASNAFFYPQRLSISTEYQDIPPGWSKDFNPHNRKITFGVHV